EEVKGYHFLRVGVSSDVNEGDNPRIRTPYRYNLRKGQTYTASMLGFTSDWIDSDFNSCGIYINSLINEKFNWEKEEIERFEYQGFTKTLYKYTYTFTFDGETGEDCAIFIGSESVNGNAAFFMFTEPMLQEGSKALP